MANEEEVLSFEITDHDLDNEFNFNLRRPKISKNQAIYGVWADNSDDDDPDARPAFGSGGGGRRKGAAKNYTAPVGFVSAGIQGQKKEIENANEDDDDDGGGGDDADPLVAGPSGSRQADSSDDGDDGDDGDASGFRIGLGAKSKKSGGAGGPKKKSKGGAGEGGGQIAGMRTANYRPQSWTGKGLGDWEKHTRGIGAKIMQQMGFEAGKGLGKNLQGRSTIIEAHLRKGRGAIGAYGSEGSRPQQAEPDSEEEEEKEFKDKLHQWRKGGDKKRVKYVYKTADQVLEEGKWRKISRDTTTAPGLGGVGASSSSSVGKVKVIDMTGREERVLSGYHAIASQQRPQDDDEHDLAASKSATHFAIPELVHNINLLMDNCEEELIAADRKLKYHKDRVEVLRMEEEKMAALVDKETEQRETLDGVLAMVEKLEALHEQDQLDLDSALEMFQKMEDKYPREYRGYELPHIATTIVAPLLKKELASWDLLAEPTRHKNTYAEWRQILSLPGGGSDESDPYYNLVWESWMPSVRACVTSSWQATRQPEPMVDFVRAWSDTVPLKIMQNVKDLNVLPKLLHHVEQWNPRQDPVPIHSWLHPWLDVLGAQLDIVHPTIRSKLASALREWHPSDKSARLILLPWRDVFDKGSLLAFLLKNIIPKLEVCLHSLPIQPGGGQLQPPAEWAWVMDWRDFIPTPTLVELLNKHFFPRWLQALAAWLSHSPDYTEVARWYQAWKKELCDSLPGGEATVNGPQVKSVLNQALDMMNRAASGGTPMSMQPGAMESMRFLASREVAPPPPPPPPPAETSSSSSFSMSDTGKVRLTDLVAKRCLDSNILFAPIPNRFHEGKQVFRCGNSLTYIDRQLLFVHRNGMWVPTSLNNLIDTAI